MPWGSWSYPETQQPQQPQPQQPAVSPRMLAAIQRMLGIESPGEEVRPMGMAQPDVIGNRPDVQAAVKSAGAGAAEPFGQLGRVMTGSSENWPMDLAGAAVGLAPIGPPGMGKALKAAGEAEHILGAAVTGTNGKVFTAPNHLLAREVAAKEFGVHPDDVWGHLEPDVGRFLTSKGRMVDRTEAGKIADQTGPLFAENLTKHPTTGGLSDFLAPIGPPGIGKALKAGAEAVESGMAKAPQIFRMFHGTDETFNAFDPAKMGANYGDWASKEGFHFAENKNLAKYFGKNVLERNIETYNPKIIDVEAALKDDYNIAVRKGDFHGTFDKYVSDHLEGNPYAYYERGSLQSDIDAAKQAGHDALVLDFGKLKDADYGKLGRTAVAFNPEQIKEVGAAGKTGTLKDKGG